MKTLVTIILMAFAATVYATDYPRPQLPDCLRYIHVVEQGQPDVTPETTPWEMAGDTDRDWISKWWASYPQPTPEHCIEVASNAVAYWANDRKDKVADFDGWGNAELKALCKVLLDEINILRAKVNLQARTAAQLKAAIKAKVK